MRTQPELVSLQRKWGQIISYLGRAAHRLKLDINSGLSLMLLTIELCWAIVPDKRAPFENTRILIQKLDRSDMEN